VCPAAPAPSIHHPISPSVTPTTAGTNRIKVCTSCQHGALPSGSNLDRAVYTPTQGIPQPRRPPSPLPAHHVLAICLPRARRLQSSSWRGRARPPTGSRHCWGEIPAKTMCLPGREERGREESRSGHWAAGRQRELNPESNRPVLSHPPSDLSRSSGPCGDGQAARDGMLAAFPASDVSKSNGAVSGSRPAQPLPPPTIPMLLSQCTISNFITQLSIFFIFKYKLF